MTSRSTAARPLVSVIIPTYNYGLFIGQTLENVQSQTYQNWECIVVDDGSTDGTDEVVARYASEDARIKYLRQKNRGQAAARNTAMRSSGGEYFQFLDADDLIEPKKFERQVGYLEGHGEVDIVYGGGYYFTEGNPDERLYSMRADNKPWMPNISGRGREVMEALVAGNIVMINAPLVRRRVVEDVGFFDESLPPVEDWDYWIRCAAGGKRFQYEDMEGTLALVRAHPSSSSKNRRRILTATILLRKKIGGLAAEAKILQLNRDLIASAEGWLGVEEVVGGSTVKGACRISKAAAMTRVTKLKVRWLACALASLFVPRRSFEKMVSSSMTQLAAGLWRGSKPDAGR